MRMSKHTNKSWQVYYEDSGSEAHVSYICDVCNNAFATEVSLKVN